MNTIEARKTALFAKTSNLVLIDSVRTLDEGGTLTQDQRLTRAWICDELERRGGGIHTYEQEVEFERLYDRYDYLTALLMMFPKLTA